HIDLGNPAIYRALAGNAAAENAEALFYAVQQKDAVGAGKLGILTELNGPVAEVIARSRKELPADAGIRAALAALEELAARCAATDVEITADLAELGGFNYESGIVFAAFTPGSPDAIARGGRYDEVGASFGRARPATGFTMDLRQLAALAPAPAARRAILAPAADDAALAIAIAQLRDAGEVVVVDLPGHDAARGELACDRRLEKKEGKWRVT